MKISNLNLAIGVPCTFPTVPTSFFYSFVHLERPDFTFIHADNGPIDTLRNDIVKTALSLGMTKLIMMDVDHIYHPKTITSLLSRNLPIVSALTFRRYPPFDSIALRSVEQDGVKGYLPVDEWEEGELLEVDAVGAACVMYDMDVFRRMPFPWFKFRVREDGQGVGEDIGFCQDLKAAGYRIFVDTAVPSDHLTTMAVNRKTNLLWRTMKTKEQQQAMERALGAKEAERKEDAVISGANG